MYLQKTRKKQKGGEKKSLQRQKGKRNLLHSQTPHVKFKNQVNVQTYEVNKIGRHVGNSSKSKTRKAYNGIPHYKNAENQQAVAELYAHISKRFNTPEQIFLEIQKIYNESNQKEDNQKLYNILKHKLIRNYYGR
jgi:hypothetical protein